MNADCKLFINGQQRWIGGLANGLSEMFRDLPLYSALPTDFYNFYRKPM